MRTDGGEGHSRAQREDGHLLPGTAASGATSPARAFVSPRNGEEMRFWCLRPGRGLRHSLGSAPVCASVPQGSALRACAWVHGPLLLSPWGRAPLLRPMPHGELRCPRLN